MTFEVVDLFKLNLYYLGEIEEFIVTLIKVEFNNEGFDNVTS